MTKEEARELDKESIRRTQRISGVERPSHRGVRSLADEGVVAHCALTAVFTHHPLPIAWGIEGGTHECMGTNSR
jgi:hypothetical protein